MINIEVKVRETPQTGLRSGRQLFDNYTFLDGSLIGKLANDQQMR